MADILTLVVWCFAMSTEQHAVEELLQLSVKGVDIDGHVLAYLEMAQVTLIKMKQTKPLIECTE